MRPLNLAQRAQFPCLKVLTVCRSQAAHCRGDGSPPGLVGVRPGAVGQAAAASGPQLCHRCQPGIQDSDGTANGAAGRWRASCCPIHAAYMAGMPYALSPPDDEKLLCSCSRLPSSCTIGTWVSVFVAVCCRATVELLQLLLASHFASCLAAYA